MFSFFFGLYEWEAGWDPEMVWTLWKTEKSLLVTGIEYPIIQPVAESQCQLRYPD